MNSNIPVITLDGPSGAGKGTIGRELAKRLQWHFLDSGSLYRLLALAAFKHQVDLADVDGLYQLAGHLDVQFQPELNQAGLKIVLDGADVSHEVRQEFCGKAASQIAEIPVVREALLIYQRAFRKLPGLIADGRDMGTIVFPDADLKFFLEASVEARAERRYGELKEKGINVSLDEVLEAQKVRDQRDRGRVTAPLKPATDAVIIDTTDLSIAEVLNRIETLVARSKCL